jgi:WhiB family redox-sensing transcriptional regulator
MEWVQRARCKDEDPELFFPIGTSGPALEQIERARAICMKCEVREACLEWALATGQDAGVWGGTSEEERKELRRSRRRQATRVPVPG